MRYPDHHKAEVRDRILRAASRLVRKLGVDGLSIPTLMKQVGLTHGGFYNHFPDREALVAEAIGFSARDGAFADPQRPFSEAVETYLSPGHVAHPEMGCVVAALGASGAPSRPVRTALAQTARGLLGRIEQMRHGSKGTVSRPVALRDDSLRAASLLVGAVVLARMVDDPTLAQRILNTARREVLRTD